MTESIDGVNDILNCDSTIYRNRKIRACIIEIVWYYGIWLTIFFVIDRDHGTVPGRTSRKCLNQDGGIGCGTPVSNVVQGDGSSTLRLRAGGEAEQQRQGEQRGEGSGKPARGAAPGGGEGFRRGGASTRRGRTYARSAVCGLRSAVCGLRSAVCGLRSAVCGLRSAVCGLRSAVCGLRSAVCGLRSAVCGLRSAVCGLRSAVCGLRSAVCGLRSAVCGLRSAVCGLRSTFYACPSRACQAISAAFS